MNIAFNLENAAKYFPDRCSVIDGGRQITYKQFNSEKSIDPTMIAAAV